MLIAWKVIDPCLLLIVYTLIVKEYKTFMLTNYHGVSLTKN
jgi:hypothetical protein